MLLNLKWDQKEQKIKLQIDDKNIFLINDDFSNVFDDTFIKFLLNQCNTLDDLKENKLIVNEESFKDVTEKNKNSMQVLKEILEEFIKGLNINVKK